MATKKVIFVNAGGYGDLSASRGDYDTLIACFSEELEKMTQAATTGSEKEKVASVTVVKSTNEAIEMIEKQDIHSLVFFSRGMIFKAQKVKKSYPRIRVVVLTGLIPDEGIIIVSKKWISSDIGFQLEQIIVG